MCTIHNTHRLIHCFFSVSTQYTYYIIISFEILFPNIVLFVIVFDVVLLNILVDGVTDVVFEPKAEAVLLFEVDPNTFDVLFPNKLGVGLEVVVPNLFS
jgi:hypothetical protein